MIPKQQKAFQKKRIKLPRKGSVERMIKRRLGIDQHHRYLREVQMGTEFPLAMREVCLARMHPQERLAVLYYPDFRAFAMYREPNRKLPIEKFFALFRGKISDAELDKVYDELTNYRLTFGRTPEEWIHVYSQTDVHSCETGFTRVRQYSHPENHLAIAALWAPGSTNLVARTIVNTEEKWYVRLFGDDLLVKRLEEIGYYRLSGVPLPFKMYGHSAGAFNPDLYELPYFDFKRRSITSHPETYDRETGLFEVTIS